MLRLKIKDANVIQEMGGPFLKTSKVELAETQLWSCRGLRLNQSNKFGFRLWEGSGSRRARSQKIAGAYAVGAG